MELLFYGDYPADGSDINGTTAIRPDNGSDMRWGHTVAKRMTTSRTTGAECSRPCFHSREILRNYAVVVHANEVGRKFNKAVIIATLLLLLNYCNGLSAEAAAAATTTSASINGDTGNESGPGYFPDSTEGDDEKDDEDSGWETLLATGKTANDMASDDLLNDVELADMEADAARLELSKSPASGGDEEEFNPTNFSSSFFISFSHDSVPTQRLPETDEWNQRPNYGAGAEQPLSVDNPTTNNSRTRTTKADAQLNEEKGSNQKDGDLSDDPAWEDEYQGAVTQTTTESADEGLLEDPSTTNTGWGDSLSEAAAVSDDLEAMDDGVTTRTVKSRRRRNNSHHQEQNRKHHHRVNRDENESGGFERTKQLMDRERNPEFLGAASASDFADYFEAAEKNTQQRLGAVSGSNKPNPSTTLEDEEDQENSNVDSKGPKKLSKDTLQKPQPRYRSEAGSWQEANPHHHQRRHRNRHEHHRNSLNHQRRTRLQKKARKNHEEQLESRRRKYAKEKYQRKLEKAQRLQLQREHKLEYQSRQLAELERQHQARQKVYFGNFAEENKRFDTIADIDQHINGIGGGGVKGAGSGATDADRYPNLARLQTQLKEDRDKDLPPYVRKYNRRNKQLFDLIEGTSAPNSHDTNGHHHHHHHARNHKQRGPVTGGLSSSSSAAAAVSSGTDHLSHKQKLERWIEENLFEEQRRNPNQIVRPPDDHLQQQSTEVQQNRVNALPGELGRPAEDVHLGAKVEVGGGEDGRVSPGGSQNVHTNRLSQTRAGNFVYHRIAQSQPSNAIGRGTAYGVVVRKPGLPFVAITDRRQEHNRPKHV